VLLEPCSTQFVGAENALLDHLSGGVVQRMHRIPK
jgi:hypothetical protein